MFKLAFKGAEEPSGEAGVRGPIVAMKLRNGSGAKGSQEGGDVKDRLAEEKPTAVPAMATQAGEVRARWAWTEPTVWTERMLTALEQGVKGGNAFFAAQGLFSLVTAQAQSRQSSSR